MSEAFSSHHIDGIQRKLDNGFLIKKSTVYTRAAVIGRPGIPGSMIISLQEDLGGGRTGWMLNLHPEAEPKALADGKVKLSGEEFRYYYWADLINGIQTLSKEI